MPKFESSGRREYQSRATAGSAHRHNGLFWHYMLAGLRLPTPCDSQVANRDALTAHQLRKRLSCLGFRFGELA